MRALQDEDARVARVAFQLATANVARCPDRKPWTGFSLHSLGQYAPGSRAAAFAAFGLDRYPMLLALVPGSAAALAGLQVGDELIRVEGRSMLESANGPASMTGVTKANDALQAALTRGPVRLTVARNGVEREVRLSVTLGCASYVELIPGRSLNARADGIIVQLTSAVVAETRDDDELAFVISHEMSHNILKHSALLRAGPRSATRVRATEIEADRLAIILMRGARYDPNAAARFWMRFGKRTGGGIFSDGTHMGTKARIAFLRELATGPAQ